MGLDGGGGLRGGEQGEAGVGGGYIPSPHNHPHRRATLGQATGGRSSSEIYSPADPTAMTLHFPKHSLGFLLLISLRSGTRESGGGGPLWKRQEANLDSASPCYAEYGIEF